jgi:hypothetical protein
MAGHETDPGCDERSAKGSGEAVANILDFDFGFWIKWKE